MKKIPLVLAVVSFSFSLLGLAGCADREAQERADKMEQEIMKQRGGGGQNLPPSDSGTATTQENGN